MRGSRGGAHDIIIYAYMHDVSQGDLGQVRARNLKSLKCDVTIIGEPLFEGGAGWRRGVEGCARMTS